MKYLALLLVLSTVSLSSFAEPVSPQPPKVMPTAPTPALPPPVGIDPNPVKPAPVPVPTPGPVPIAPAPGPNTGYYVPGGCGCAPVSTYYSVKVTSCTTVTTVPCRERGRLFGGLFQKKSCGGCR